MHAISSIHPYLYLLEFRQCWMVDGPLEFAGGINGYWETKFCEWASSGVNVHFDTLLLIIMRRFYLDIFLSLFCGMRYYP